MRKRKQRDQIIKGAPTRKKFMGPHKGQHPQIEEAGEFAANDAGALLSLPMQSR